ncbi:Chromosome partition protein Smc [Dissostichus eleginoides]|uniref:Chromosome partition protein Smc n=1 Tax=Dissostichus eleginoides TaxID=100907 RepID=A0AAD9FMM6_DISEL|nr:Chromosome partition protein Smc [Dissostichus eleginoides]
MTSELEEDKKVIEKLQIDHHASSSQHQRDISQLMVLNTASVTAIKDRLTELQEESVKKDKDIESLHSNVLNLQSDIVAKVSIVTSLQERVNKCASDLTEEQTKSSSLQMDNEAAVSLQKKEAEELARLTQGNQHLVHENRRLQSELEATLNKQLIEEKKLQGDRGACSKLEEAIKKEEARFSRASKNIQSQEKELSEKTLALEGLQRDNEAAVSLQKNEAEELARLTQGNQHLVYEKKRMQSELAALNKQHIEEKKLQGDRGACSRLEEAIKKEEARFSRASKKIQSQEKELSEKTLALEKSLTAEKLLKSSLKSEKKRFERMVGKQASAGPLSILTQQLREASAYDMQTLRMENADIRAKFLVLEREYDRERFELRSLSAGHEEMLSRKNDSISDNQFTITNLQCIVNEFKAKESKIKMRQADLEEALKQEKTRNSELHHTVDQISSSLEKERTRCEKHRVELQEALKKQITTLEENNKLTLSLQKAQETFPRLQEKQRAETNYNFGIISDTEFRLREQKYSLDESNKALYHLQQEYTNLGRRHCDINAEYRELLKIHAALQVRHERLSYAQGNPRPDFSPYLFQSNCTAH